MCFAGLSRDQQRADVIAYLRTWSDSPKPLPTAEGGAPAEKK
jgi:cytochrome c